VTQSADSLGSPSPPRVVTDDHFKVRVTHLMSDVLRIFSARKLERGEGVTALIDRAGSQTRPDQNSLPVSIPEVREIDRAANVVQENELAAHLRARSLLLEFHDYWIEHINVALTRRRLRQSDSAEAMNRAANLELLAIEINVFPAKRKRFVWPQAAEDEDGDDRAILASRPIEKPLRLL